MRRALTTLPLLAVALAGAPAAQASTLTAAGTSSLHYAATAGESTRLSITYQSGQLVFTDSGAAGISVGPECSSSGGQASCPASAITSIVAVVSSDGSVQTGPGLPSSVSVTRSNPASSVPVGPALSLAAAAAPMSALGAVGVPLSCPASAVGRCQGLVELALTGQIVASQQFLLLPGQQAAVILLLTPDVRTAVTQARTLPMIAEFSAQDNGGAYTSGAAPLTVTAPPPAFVRHSPRAVSTRARAKRHHRRRRRQRRPARHHR